MSEGGAAAAAEMQKQEEEEITPYTTQDLSEGWEFKILRSNFATFRKPEQLQAILDEEKRGGWTLVEKFDDSRIRLKRPAGSKVTQGEFNDTYDPYRTTIGVSQGGLVMMVLAISAAIGAGLLAFAILLSR
jgi:hypothetical protein